MAALGLGGYGSDDDEEDQQQQTTEQKQLQTQRRSLEGKTESGQSTDRSGFVLGFCM
jgi:hypothetical protein